MNKKLTSLLTVAIFSGLVAGSMARAEEVTAPAAAAPAATEEHAATHEKAEKGEHKMHEKGEKKEMKKKHGKHSCKGDCSGKDKESKE
jgi:Ni/Co efflux regulator RcnB